MTPRLEILAIVCPTSGVVATWRDVPGAFALLYHEARDASRAKAAKWN